MYLAYNGRNGNLNLATSAKNIDMIKIHALEQAKPQLPAIGCLHPVYSPKRHKRVEVINFTGFLQPVNKLQQTYQFQQVATSLLKSAYIYNFTTYCKAFDP